MKTTQRRGSAWMPVLALVTVLIAGCESVPTEPADPHHLTAFRSDSEFRHYLERWTVSRSRRSSTNMAEVVVVTGSRMPPPPSGTDVPSITNNQEAAVDEGDIVKLRGHTLIILRRARLFTISIADGAMRPVDSIDAYPPGIDAHEDWYDEMLVTQNRLVVIGYSYKRRGTQINRFRIDDSGHLTFEDAYQLRSDDYYSSRNYASRLIGHRLILYSPSYLPWRMKDLPESLPAMRRWTPEDRGTPNSTDRSQQGFEPIVSARQIYVAPIVRDSKDAERPSLHTVTTCDLTATIIDCKGTSLLGPEGRSFYVSEHAVYVWVTDPWGYDEPKLRGRPPAFLYRLPLDGGPPSAIGVRGSPDDQFSFREDPDALNVLVRAENGGDAMWRAEYSEGAVALLRIPPDAFGDGSHEADLSDYRPLPAPSGDTYSFHNRFAGDYVLYGNGNAEYEEQSSVLVAAPIHGGPVAQVRLAHGIDRIELMGRDAVIVGSGARDLYFSTIDLAPGLPPRLGDRFAWHDASQAETRSHAFFFNPDANPSATELERGTPGVLGLPVARPARPVYHQLFETSAAMVYLRRSNGRFSALGELTAHDAGVVDDHCVASCYDWYGDARPIFIGNRIFALMGYEIVEAKLSHGEIREIGRVNYARPGKRP